MSSVLYAEASAPTSGFDFYHYYQANQECEFDYHREAATTILESLKTPLADLYIAISALRTRRLWSRLVFRVNIGFRLHTKTIGPYI